MTDLFGNAAPELPDRALTPKERRKLLTGRTTTLPRGHAAAPGTGPAGETCKSCAHYTLRRYAKVYRKCGLMESKWTGGGATDIRAADPACSKWEQAVEAPVLVDSYYGGRSR